MSLIVGALTLSAQVPHTSTFFILSLIHEALLALLVLPILIGGMQLGTAAFKSVLRTLHSTLGANPVLEHALSCLQIGFGTSHV